MKEVINEVTDSVIGDVATDNDELLLSVNLKIYISECKIDIDNSFLCLSSNRINNLFLCHQYGLIIINLMVLIY